ncbi:MAG: site-specific integrase [Rikenellaceae bacterium]
MAKLTVKTKENPKLQQSTLSDGRISLYLEYYLGRTQWVDEKTGKIKVKHDRKKESLNLYLLANPRTTAERQKNKDKLELAGEIRAEREQQFKADKTGKRIKSSLKKVNLYDFFDNYVNSYTKKDIRMIQASLTKFREYIATNYPIYANTLKPEQLTHDMIVGYVEYLEGICRGEGARGYFQRFKKVIKSAVQKDVILKNPCIDKEGKVVICKVDDQTLKKDILSQEEVMQLISTTYTGQNENIRRAFIFCLYAGLRFCDIVDLKYKNVDYSNRMLKFEQAKTKGHSANSGVTIPLNDGLLSLIGTPPEGEGKEALIFELPSHTMCLKALRRWVARAGIDKHITWHCARHSFAVNILNNGANIKTVASLLGHSGLKHTEKYTRAVDELKEKAINSLPELKPEFNL